MPNHNNERLSEDIKREISASLMEIKDPRVAGGLVTITGCEVTRDLSYCKVYLSCLGGEEKTKDAVECLAGASGFFKKRINGRIKMRKIPELIFKADNSLEYYEKISSIIDTFPKKDDENENR